MKKCDVCRVALNNDGYPYILPLNFGKDIKDDKIELYFHRAIEGTKYELIKKDNRASFEMNCEHKLKQKLNLEVVQWSMKALLGKDTLKSF